MLLTIFYASATLLQSWRMRSLSAIIMNKIRESYSVSFYKTGTDESGLNSIGASSDKCDNFKNVRIVDTLWYENVLRGVSLLPKMQLSVNEWTTFSMKSPHLNPLFCSKAHLTDDLDDSDVVYILLEAGIYPDIHAITNGSEIVSAERFGNPLAWKIDTCLAIVLRSNISLYAEFVRQTFLQNNLHINNYLPITRLENVSIYGTPQQLTHFDIHSEPMSSSSLEPIAESLTESQYHHHLDKLKILSLVANLQADPSPDDYEKEIVETKTSTRDCNSISPAIFEDTTYDTHLLGEAEGDSEIASHKIESTLSAVHGQLDEFQAEPEPELAESVQQMNGSIKTVSNGQALLLSKENGECVKESQSLPTPSDESGATTAISFSQYSTLMRHKRSSNDYKPPNVLVYSESIVTRTNVISTIKKLLHPDRYTIYELNTEQLKTTFWIDSTTLLIVCGPTSHVIGSILMEYYLCGGKMLCLCSDVLNMLLPIYRTAEVRENELVQFSYGQWHKVQLMHHIFCYHPSPIKKHFSVESDDQQENNQKQKPPMTCPGSVELKDLRGDIHQLHVNVLGTEETWNTPSLILATDTHSNGVAVFSQVHLEVDPNLYENDDSKYSALKMSDNARLEILSDLLSTQLGLQVCNINRSKANLFPSAYFLGCYEVKQEMLNKINRSLAIRYTLKVKDIIFKFFAKNESPPADVEHQIPILIHSCPENFSTVNYFGALRTKYLGRLVIYAPLITSTQSLLTNLKGINGLAVIGRKQTNGIGRHSNQWLSPDGCALYSIQLNISMNTPLGQKLPLLQHIASLAVVRAITNMEVYKKLDIRLKWPNDIYAYGSTKLGGVIANTEIYGMDAICNIGVGFNLDNSVPTTCLNDMIKSYNLKHSTTLPYMGYEQFFASVFNEMESIIETVQTGNMAYLFDLYYKNWLHSDAEIVIIDLKGKKKLATIIGVDEFGYLLVQQPGQAPESVHPDGNSFDILRGLISAKHF